MTGVTRRLERDEFMAEATAFLDYASGIQLPVEQAWREWTKSNPWDPADRARVLLLVLGRMAEDVEV